MKYDYYITGTIGEAYDWWTGQRGTTANDVKSFLEAHKDKEVNIAVSSHGGYIDEGIIICELIAAHGKCNMFIIGMTASAATVLCMKAKSVKIAKGSMMLIHNSSLMLDVWTSANKQGIDSLIESFKKHREDLDTIDKAIASIYSSRNGKTIEDNMAMMDKEKWMLAQDALDFGIVDAIVDETEVTAQAKAVKDACAARNGLAEHYGIPSIPLNEEDKRSLWSRMRESLSTFSHAMNSITEANQQEQKHNSSNAMKKTVLNLICSCLGVADFTANDKGEFTLTEDQLNKLEDSFKQKDERITALEAELKTAKDAAEKAQTEKADAENKFLELQKEHEELKNEAGGHSSTTVTASETETVTAASLYESVKSLL